MSTGSKPSHTPSADLRSRSNLAQLLRAMDHPRFLLLCTQMHASMLSRLQLAQQVGNELADILQDVGYANECSPKALTDSTYSLLNPISISSFFPDPTPPSTARPTAVPSLDLSDVLSSACELANARASKILAVRSEQHAALSLTEFVELFKENWDFVGATETLAKGMIVSLRGVTASQVRRLIMGPVWPC